MKRILNYSALLILTIVLLTSCGSQKSFADRHYNNRYYIGMSKAEKTPKVKNDNLETITPATEEEFTLTSNTETQNIENTITTDSPDEVKVTTEEAIAPTPEEKVIRQKGSSPKFFDLSNRKSDEIPFAILEKAEKVKEKISPPASSDDALSLLWIVIVIILILWLLGYALGGLGLGGAIHILLVIALILLILWLLGII